jgi:hypothetical protein
VTDAAIEDIPASISPGSEPPACPLRGHAAKVLEAVTALRAEGRLPPNMWPTHRDKLIQDQLRKAGYGEDIPDRNAIRRAWQRLGLGPASERNEAK